MHLLFRFIYFVFMHVLLSSVHVSVPHVCLVSSEVRRSQIPWNWMVPDMDGCKSPCASWELNQDPLNEQPVLLTTESTKLLDAGDEPYNFRSFKHVR